MKRIRILGLALLALFAVGVVVASTAAAEEKEPAGLLFLAGQSAPVTLEGSGKEAKLQTLGGKSPANITCTANAFKGTAGAKGETHVTLGTVTITFSACKAEIAGSSLPCSSENAKAEKDAKEIILVEGDLHFVSLETAAKKLVPGTLVILLTPVKINCSGVKTIVEGTAIGEVENPTATADVTELALNFVAIPKLLKCDEKDALCIKLIKEFGCAKSGSLCGNLSGENENADQIAKVTAKVTPMVSLDY